MSARFLTNLSLFVAMASLMAYATDPNQLDDFCVAAKDHNSAVLVNGQLCKNPLEVTADDFLFKGSILDGSNQLLTPANLPGLNTLGISVLKLYFPPGGTFPPHTHQRGNEVVTVLEGSLYVGFVSYNQDDNSAKLYAQVLYPGDVFVFPEGLLHFLINVGETDVVGMVAYSGQNPSTIVVAPAIFKAHPPISVDLLSKAFKLDPKIVMDLQSKNYPHAVSTTSH